MLTLGPLSFSAAWLLSALLALPALWWLLRVSPPAPRRYDFPAIRLLFGLMTQQQTAESAPLWLILLRLALVSVVIIAAAGPAWHRAQPPDQGPLLLVVDNGWAAGKHWGQKRARLQQLVAEAARTQQTVALLTTAPPADGGALALQGPMPADSASAALDALVPLPWLADHAAAATALDALPHGHAMRVLWMSDGLWDADVESFASRLQTFGRLEMALPSPDDLAQQALPPRNDAGEAHITLRRVAGGTAQRGVLRALDEQGRSLALLDIPWPSGNDSVTLALTWPSELKNRIARLVIDGEDTAGAVALLDGLWSRHAVGLVDQDGQDRVQLLNDLFYAERALQDFAEIRHGTLEALLQQPLSMIILPDRGGLSATESESLRRWVSQGGSLLRFAGPALAGNPDDLLPVRVRASERMLGGALSWAQPMALAPMPEDGPFAGLAIPSDLTVSTQILAEPDLSLNDKSWAKLTDGTPLVTGSALGKGWLVLIHTTAWPGWSNLALSGLFPEMLHRLLDRSAGLAPQTSVHPLPALRQLDGWGHLQTPSGAAESWPAGTPPTQLGPRHPPGLYGNGGGRRAVNLAPFLPPPKALALPAGAVRLTPQEADAMRDLRPACLLIAVLLLLADLFLLTRMRRRAALSAALILLIGLPIGQGAAAADDIAAILDPRLAYVITGNGPVDTTSRDGLAALSRQILRRTTAVLAEPAGIDLERDQLSVYPLLYWPMTSAPAALSERAQSRLNGFLRQGGLLLIDSRDGGGTDPGRLRLMTRGIDIPPLAPINDQHVLARSFYLLHDFPGRLAGGALFGEKDGDAAHDFVSPVLIGGNDWAAAWAVDQRGDPSFPVVPGGEMQREMAIRFGINLVMYALTGSYKADQVHVPAILDRMHR